MATDIPLGLFLWKRIRQLGIESIFGVPGDFNLNFLDFIYDVPGLKWIGNANELGAAYAADGYGRTRDAPGCLVTTHGVGELSALNGIAGSMSEHVPIIHVVGQTQRAHGDQHLMIHHSIGTSPDHQLYNKTSAHLRCAAAELCDAKTAPAEIDRVLRQCWIQKLPVYIFFPIDMTAEKVPANALDVPLDTSLPANEAVEQAVVAAICDALQEAKSPALFVDFLTRSHGQAEARRLVDALPFPVYASHMSKGAVDETHERYVGLYNGGVSLPGIPEAMEASDLVLAIGWWPCDSNNTAFFSRKLEPERRIDIMDTYVVVQGKRYDDVYMGRILDQLTTAVKQLKLPPIKMPSLVRRKLVSALDAPQTNGVHQNGDVSPPIRQKYIWPRLGAFLKPGDVLLADTGTASYGMPSCPLPKDAVFLSQSYYGSIGHATPCALGVDMALRELHAANPSNPRRRTVLVTGDGSLQLTIQEVGTMIARRAPVVIMIINNAGYTIERAIHGASQTYNDIAPYDFSHMLSLFGQPTCTEGPDRNFRQARTEQEFEAAMSEDVIVNPKQVQVIEVFMDRLDIPWQLAALLKNRIPGCKEYYDREGFVYSEEPV